MTEEGYFAAFAAALFAAFRTDKHDTQPRRDIVRALGEARIAAHVAEDVYSYPLEDLGERLDEWHTALGEKLKD